MERLLSLSQLNKYTILRIIGSKSQRCENALFIQKYVHKGFIIFLEYINIYIIALHTMTWHFSHHFSFYTDILAATFSHLHCDQASRLPPGKRTDFQSKQIFND